MPSTDQLRRAAALYGILPEYLDVAGRPVQASPETLLRLLQELGAPVAGPRDLAGANRARVAAQWGRTLAPVLVAWDGRLDAPLRLSAAVGDRYAVYVELEDGQPRAWGGHVADLPIVRRKTVDGCPRVVRRLRAKDALPHGYHRLSFRAGCVEARAMVVSAPLAAYRPGARWWGVFLPLYALHREQSWGAGDFSDLTALMQWVAGLGGNLVATLPILAPVDLAQDPSPYNPSTRFFWNEFYLDLHAPAELARSPAARKLLEGIEGGDELRALRRRPMVDHAGVMRLKRQVLERLAETYFRGPSPRRAALEQYLAAHPRAEAYARFRAAGERHGPDWRTWPAPLRGGQIGPGDCDEDAFRYHLYAQWQAAEQLHAAVAGAEEKGLAWYFDYPLGVSRAGFDAWREPDLFMHGVSAGAPPDAFFTKGQNWDFPPLSPDRLRETHYRYFIDAVRRHLEYARILRIDHIMGMYRLYWVPSGAQATDGAYVRYPVEEFMAILVLESHRRRAWIVGENLGTVPPEVDQALHRHGLSGMYVLQFGMKPDRRRPLDPVPAGSAASLNTHDLPTFTGFLEGRDFDDRIGLGLLDARHAARGRKERAKCRAALVEVLRRRGLIAPGADDPASITEGALALLGASDAEAVLVGLEDLWGETAQQNTPGTTDERPNWRRRARHPLEKLTRLRAVKRALNRLNEARKQT